MTHQPGTFIGVGIDGIRVFSKDGRTWSGEGVASRTQAKNRKASWKGGGAFWGLGIGPGRAVAVGPFGSKGAIRATTADGMRWSDVELLDKSDGRLLDVTYGSDRFVAVGGEVPNYIHAYWTWSEDGLQWSSMQHIARKENRDAGGLLRVAYGNDRFVALGRAGKAAISDNGETWEFSGKEDSNPIQDTFIEIAYGAGVFVGTGLHGLRMTSTDGVRWTDKATGPEGEHINSIVWTGKQFVGAAPHATYFSSDGYEWDRVKSNDAPTVIAYGNGIFTGSKYHGIMLRSSDAVRWEQVDEVERHVLAMGFLPTS